MENKNYESIVSILLFHGLNNSPNFKGMFNMPIWMKSGFACPKKRKTSYFLHDLIHLATHHLMEKLEMQGAGQTNSKVKWPLSFIKDFNKLYNSSLIWEYFKINTNFYFL